MNSTLDRFSHPLPFEPTEDLDICYQCESPLDESYVFDGEKHCLECVLEVAGIEKVSG